MGEIANDIIEGRSCSLYGMYFTEEHGDPVRYQDYFDPEDGTVMAIHPLISEGT